jgi:hypothetical protein
MENNEEQIVSVDYELGKEIIAVTKATVDRILKSDNPADALALYMFYAYTAKWQETNSAYATTQYSKKGLDWGRDRMKNAKKTLMDLGLIKNVRRTHPETGRVLGWYIKVNYLMKNPPLQVSDRVGNQHPNALY